MFRVAITGDFLGPDGKLACGDAGWSRLLTSPLIQHHFLAGNIITLKVKAQFLGIKTRYLSDIVHKKAYMLTSLPIHF